MSLKRKYGLLASSAAVALLLAACAGDADTNEEVDTGTDNGTTENADNGAEDVAESGYPDVIENEGEAVDGATLRIALVAESAFPGIFSTEYYSINTDSQIMGPMLG